MKVKCLACGEEREPSGDELRARSVEPCPCGNGSYSGINWGTFQMPASFPDAPVSSTEEE